MKDNGIIRRIDELGRIVLPIELRRSMDWKERDRVEIFAEKDQIILKKYEEKCVFCGAEKDLRAYRGKRICGRCARSVGTL